MLCLIKIMKIMTTIWGIFLDMTIHIYKKIHIIMPMNMFTRMGIRMNIIMSIEIYLMLLL